MRIHCVYFSRLSPKDGQNQTFLPTGSQHRAVWARLEEPLEKGKEEPLTQTLPKAEETPTSFISGCFLPQGSVEPRDQDQVCSRVSTWGLQLTVPSTWNALPHILRVFHSLCSGVCSESLWGALCTLTLLSHIEHELWSLHSSSFLHLECWRTLSPFLPYSRCL